MVPVQANASKHKAMSYERMLRAEEELEKEINALMPLVQVISLLCHGRAIPLFWQMLEHPSAIVSAEVVIALRQRADRLVMDFRALTVLADQAFPSTEPLSRLAG